MGARALSPLAGAAAHVLTGKDDIDLNTTCKLQAANVRAVAANILLKAALGDGWARAGDIAILPMKTRGDCEPYWTLTARREWRVRVDER